MPALLRVCRNVARRAWPYILWFVLVLFVTKVWMVNPWKTRVSELTHQVNQLYQKLTEKDEALEKNFEKQLQEAIEKERSKIQQLIDSGIATALASHVQQTSTSPTTVAPESAPVAAAPSHKADWEKAWPLIEQKYHQGQPWADVVPTGQAPEACVRTKGAPTQDQLVKACQDVEGELDSTSQDAPKPWWSSLVRVRRLDSVGSHSADIIELLEKQAWQDAIAQLESHPNKDHTKVKALIQSIKERLSYEQAFAQLTTWKKQLCATSVP